MNAITGNLQTAVNLDLYKKVKDLAGTQMSQALQDFANAQPTAPHPFLGSKLDIQV